MWRDCRGRVLTPSRRLLRVIHQICEYRVLLHCHVALKFLLWVMKIFNNKESKFWISCQRLNSQNKFSLLLPLCRQINFISHILRGTFLYWLTLKAWESKMFHVTSCARQNVLEYLWLLFLSFLKLQMGEISLILLSCSTRQPSDYLTLWRIEKILFLFAFLKYWKFWTRNLENNPWKSFFYQIL